LWRKFVLTQHREDEREEGEPQNHSVWLARYNRHEESVAAVLRHTNLSSPSRPAALGRCRLEFLHDGRAIRFSGDEIARPSGGGAERWIAQEIFARSAGRAIYLCQTRPCKMNLFPETPS